MAVGTEFSVLGPLDVRVHGAAVPLAGTRLRTLCCRLLVAQGAPVAAATLVDDLWSGSPTPAAVATLQSHVGRLRRAVGSARVGYGHGAYWLDTDGAVVDATQAAAELTAGREALASGDPRRGALGLEAALHRWRGRPFADVAEAPWAAGEIARLEELRAAIVEAWLQSLLAVGANDRVVAHAEAELVTHPYRERIWEALLLALYRQGRQVDALDAYRRLRRSLRQNLGLDPWPRLVDLERSILEQRPDLDAAPTREVGRPATVTMAAALPVRLARQLSTAMVGRAHHIAHLREELERARRGELRVAVATGPIGAGRTRLLAEVAALAVGSGVAVRYGRGDRHAPPYQPIIDALDAAGAPPAGGERAVDLHRERLLTEALAASGPSVVLLDDLQDADPGTLHLLERWVADGSDAPVLVVATHRAAVVRTGDPAVRAAAVIRAEGGFEAVLEPLRVEDVADLVRDRLGVGSRADHLAVAAALRAATGGNPLLLRALAAEVATTAVAAGPNGPWPLHELALRRPAPIAVHDFLDRCLAELSCSSDDARRVLAPLAVEAAPTTAGRVAQAVRAAEEDVVAVLDEGCRIGLLHVALPEGAYGFVHPIVRSCLAEELSPARRALLRRSLAPMRTPLGSSTSGPFVLAAERVRSGE